MNQLPYLPAQWSLLLGITLSFFIQGHQIQEAVRPWSTRLLQISLILLGASLNFHSIILQTKEGVLITLLSLIFVFILGVIGQKLLKVDKIQGTLITMGTAICGGSAIGALAPVINADAMAITVSISVVFILNALAVFIFPFLGELFSMTQDQFGLWAALAIHDTSSVVGASALYGSGALEVATTIKLIRALWIIPITLTFSLLTKADRTKKVPVPWFIFGLLLLSLLFTMFNLPVELKLAATWLSKNGFAVTLFLIGLNFDLQKMKKIGIKPLILGSLLWIIVSATSLLVILTLQ
jgi:uncharacterized integral membrane protein (TIGR00698 family)